MTDIYLNVYNNLIKLTRNKNLYIANKSDSFYDRIIILFFHLSFLLKNYKTVESKKDLQNFFDFTIRQIELSIRETGYGDATINKKMKDYVNLLYSIIDQIDQWEMKNLNEKIEIFKKYIEKGNNYETYVDYFEKYRTFLLKNTFNALAKDIITL